MKTIHLGAIVVADIDVSADDVHSTPLQLAGVDGFSGLFVKVDTWDTADIALQASTDGGTTWDDIRDSAGALFRVTNVSTGDWLRLPDYATDLSYASGALLRIRSVTVEADTDEAQSADVRVECVLLI